MGTKVAPTDTIIGRRGYPVSFERALGKTYTHAHRVQLPDGRAIDAYAHLLRPVIVPEHLLIFDDGVMLGKAHPQVQEHALEATLAEPVNPLPLDEVTRLAFNCFVAACASDQRPLQLLGMVVALEVMDGKPHQTESEVVAITAIASTLEALPANDEGTAWKTMRKFLVERLRTFKWLSKSRAIAMMMQINRGAVESALGDTHPWSLDAEKATGRIYKLRSKIAHDGKMSGSNEDVRVVEDLKRLTGALLETRYGRSNSVP